MSGKGGWHPGAPTPVDGGLVSSAKATIITCAVLIAIVTGVGVVRHIGSVDPKTGKRAPSGAARPFMGLTVAVVFLLLLAQKAPRLAAQFATLITVTVLLRNGPVAFGKITTALKAPPVPGKPTATAQNAYAQPGAADAYARDLAARRAAGLLN